MAEAKDFGTILKVPSEPEGEVPLTIARNHSKHEIERLMRGLDKDSAQFSTVSWVDIPDDLPSGAREDLLDLYHDVEDYRTWATVEWWDRVDRNPNLPKGDDAISIQRRMSHFAYVAFEETKRTEWYDQLRPLSAFLMVN